MSTSLASYWSRRNHITIQVLRNVDHETKPDCEHDVPGNDFEDEMDIKIVEGFSWYFNAERTDWYDG